MKQKLEKLFLLVLTALFMSISPDLSAQAAYPNFINPSFEGGPAGTHKVPKPWFNCTFNNMNPHLGSDTYSLAPLYPASDSNNCVASGANWDHWNYPTPTHVQEGVSGRVTIFRGVEYCFKVDMMRFKYSHVFAHYEVYAGNDSCSKGELLWFSPKLDTTWNTYTVSFIPKKDYSFITFYAFNNDSTTNLMNAYCLIDNIRDCGSAPVIVKNPDINSSSFGTLVPGVSNKTIVPTIFIDDEWVRVENESSLFSIKVFDLSGKLVFSGEGSARYDIPTITWPEGVYVINTHNNSGISSKKVMIRRR